jgi:quercetin dioxygenase-like cupin family protein
MDRKYTLTLASCFLGLMLCVGFGSVNGQQAAPTETKGFTVKPLSAVDLGPEIEGMAGRQLRMRMITIEPGGFLGIHSHKDRPGTVYVLQGKFTVHLGDVVKEYGVGDTWSENKETTHWLENKGTTPAVLIATDIFHQP